MQKGNDTAAPNLNPYQISTSLFSTKLVIQTPESPKSELSGGIQNTLVQMSTALDNHVLKRKISSLIT